MNIADKSSYSGGVLNCICEGACYAFIGGGGGQRFPVGQGNTVCGNYSAILGGSGNTVSGAYTYAAVFGHGITAVASNTLHVSCLNAAGTPTSGSILPAGTIYYSTTPLPGAKQLYII
jgi:hypothetical protein